MNFSESVVASSLAFPNAVVIHFPSADLRAGMLHVLLLPCRSSWLFTHHFLEPAFNLPSSCRCSLRYAQRKHSGNSAAGSAADVSLVTNTKRVFLVVVEVLVLGQG